MYATHIKINVNVECKYVYFAALVREPLEVGRESSHEMKELFNLQPLVLKARHLSGSAFLRG